MRNKNERLKGLIKALKEGETISDDDIAAHDLREANSGLGGTESCESLIETEGELSLSSAHHRTIEWILAGALQVIPVPETLAEVKPWVDQYLADKIELHPRAIRSAAKAIFEDVKLVYQTLLLLGDYRDMIVEAGDKEKERAFKQKLRELKVSLRKSITATGMKNERIKQDYRVQWNGASHILEWAIKRGKARDPKRTMRVYFFYDNTISKIVVGSMPQHLHNQLS